MKINYNLQKFFIIKNRILLLLMDDLCFIKFKTHFITQRKNLFYLFNSNLFFIFLQTNFHSFCFKSLVKFFLYPNTLLHKNFN